MIALHAVFSTYGFWLPNDPRGSGSQYVGSRAIYSAAGRATKVTTRRRVAAKPHDASLREEGKRALKRRPVVLNGLQARAVARGFDTAIQQSGHRLLACAVLPDHVHIVAAAGRYRPKQVVGHLKRNASQQLAAEKQHPFEASFRQDGKPPSCWGEGSWTVFLDTTDDMHRTIRYVDENPLKEGKPRQRWWFVERFDG